MFSNGVRQVGIENDETLVGVVTHRSVTRAQLLLAESGLTEGLLRRQVTLAMEDPQPMVD